jgi:hypothetical protein
MEKEDLIILLLPPPVIITHIAAEKMISKTRIRLFTFIPNTGPDAAQCI